MTPTEAAMLLTIAASYDNRKPDADQAKAWAMVLDDLRFVDAHAWALQAEAVALGYDTELAEYAAEHPRPTLKAFLVGLAGTHQAAA